MTFFNCKSLKSISLPSHLLGMDRSAFEDCGEEKIIIPGSVSKIAYYAFRESKLKYVEIENGVKGIEDGAFYGCEDLIEVSIPESVTSVYYNSFYECKKLQAINVNDDNTAYTSENGVLMNKNKTSINVYPSGKKESTYTIGKSISYVNAYLFKYCSNLQAFNVEEENANYSAEDGVLFNKDKTRIERYPVGKTDAYIINSSITDIGYNAFEGCNNVHITVAAGSRLNASSFSMSGLSDSQIANITFEN